MSTALNYSKQTVWDRLCIGNRIEWNVRKFRKILILIGFLGMFLLILPTAWSDTRFEMEPGKVAVAEVRMWQAYYVNDHIALRQELTNLLRNQFGLSVSDANDIGEPLAGAVMKFESAKNNYNRTSKALIPRLKISWALVLTQRKRRSLNWTGGWLVVLPA